MKLRPSIAGRWLALCAVVFLAIACSEQEMSDLDNNSIIPRPREVIADGEWFSLGSRTVIFAGGGSEELEAIGIRLSKDIQELTGAELPVLTDRITGKRSQIELLVAQDDSQDPEAYTIGITKKKITVSAASPEGIYRGYQTLRQLLELDALRSDRKGTLLMVPGGSIKDSPEYPYRGTMLDVARHFFPVDVLKKHIDRIALYKINHLHLHLSDDQGWRIEIRSWPELTNTGGSTEVGGGEGGYYTQEEYAGIVSYAAERYITIVPEIDMPGHTNAALASYAELNCDGKARELYTGTRVGFSTLCTSKEIVYEFVDDVVGEISALSPGPYFHVGGDESHVTALEDYIPFINRVQDIVKAHGKTMIGWDEISHADLDPGSVSQYWASAENALRSVEKGTRVLLSPASRCYLDMQYDEATALGLHWAAYIELDSAYRWYPEKLVNGIGKEDILGIESPLWGETIQTLEDIDYLAFPRLIGHAEIGWTEAGKLDWENYRSRLKRHTALLDRMGVSYYNSFLLSGLFTDHADIGECMLPGKLEFHPGKNQFTITGSGENMWFAADQFHFAWLQHDSDFILRAKISFVGEGRNAHRKIGLMIRNSTDTSSVHVSAVVHGDGLTSLQYRDAYAADTKELKSEASAPDAVQLERSGSSYIFTASKGGQVFKEVIAEDILLDPGALVGIFICSHDNSVAETAVFRKVELLDPGKGGNSTFEAYISTE